MGHLHPVFGAILAAHGMPQDPDPDPATQQYEQDLRDFDWTFEFSDDHHVWTQARRELARLRELQRTLDPELVIWSRYAR